MTDSATERLLKSASKLCDIHAYLLRFFATAKLIEAPCGKPLGISKCKEWFFCKFARYWLRQMRSRLHFHLPPTTSEIIGLHFLKHSYRRDKVLKWALAKMSLKRRMRLIRTAGMNRLESWIFTRYLNSVGKKLSVKRVAAEVARNFDIPANGALYKTVHRIRRKAYRERAKQKILPQEKLCR